MRDQARHPIPTLNEYLAFLANLPVSDSEPSKSRSTFRGHEPFAL